jgi:hypothetical protein
VRNLVRRLKRLEQQHFDVTGLVPRSEAWYEFYWDKMDRLLAGEDIRMKIPLEAFDEMMRRGELAEEEKKAADPEGYSADLLRRRQEMDSGNEW